MGLDMYLKASKYVGNWKHANEDEKAKYAAITHALGLDGLSCEGSPHLTVNICVAYWRKSNQIHKWFVDNCQDGVDDCREAYLSRDQLTQLCGLCEQALKTQDASALPPKSGFFFGSSEVTEWYWDDLKLTVTQLKAVLENPALTNFDFYYHSSW